MTSKTPKPIHSLILDAGPIIKNDPSVSTLLAQAEILYTIPAVIDEIRDEVTRTRIESTLLPFLKLRSPRSASIKVIADFARKTGDAEVLSRPDIHLMALAYELECERNHGDWRLRTTPGQKRVNGPPPAALGEEVVESQNTDEGETKVELKDAPIPSNRGAWGTAAPPAETSAEELKPNMDTEVATIEETLACTQLSQSEVTPSVSTPEAVMEPVEPTKPDAESQEFSETIVEDVQDDDSEESDGEGWITPSNLKKHQAKDANGSVEPQEEIKTMQVALITSDFAMQNVLLRMNLNLLSPSLQRIKQLKTWVLRCHACFSITKNMTKQFCDRCGKPTLMRTSCSTDKDGNFKVHLKQNMQWNNRGNVFSIPKPVAGTSNGKLVAGGGKGGWGQSLILTEDQKEYVKAMTGAGRKKEKDLMDEDYLPSLLSGDRGHGGNRPKVGAGKNVNSKKRNKK